MKRIRIYFFFLLILSLSGTERVQAQGNSSSPGQVERIFVWGGDLNQNFVQYVAGLTQKEHPRICFLPTASADNSEHINYWNQICHRLQLDTVILKVWVSSSSKNQSFEDLLLHSDAIVVGGGNTLNMLGIWKAQGIDSLLAIALKKGIILAGGSAGSICWFQSGISDSRPVKLSRVKGLGFLPYSNCPHYSQEKRRELYLKMIEEGKMNAGYGCDELSGILFENGKAVKSLTQSDRHHSCFVSLKQGRINEKMLRSDVLLAKGALPKTAYSSYSVNQKVAELLKAKDQTTAEYAYALERTKQQNQTDISDSLKNSRLAIEVMKVYNYQNKLVGVVNDAYLSSMGFYGLWYFYRQKDHWISKGEGFGGASLFESEIRFRESAKLLLQRAEKQAKTIQ